MRSTTEGEVLLTRLLGGEGSALGDMVRFVYFESKNGLLEFSRFFKGEVRRKFIIGSKFLSAPN